MPSPAAASMWGGSRLLQSTELPLRHRRHAQVVRTLVDAALGCYSAHPGHGAAFAGDSWTVQTESRSPHRRSEDLWQGASCFALQLDDGCWGATVGRPPGPRL